MRTRANIFDPISKELDPTVFNGKNPKPELMEFIERGLKKYMPRHVSYSLVLTGSITTFQYGPTSDIDISVFPVYPEDEIEAKQLNRELVSMVVGNLDGILLPGTTHPLQHFIVGPGIGPEDLYHPGIRSGWSFRTKKWIVPPEKGRSHEVEKEMPDLFVKATQMAEKMEHLLAHSPKRAIKFFEQIHEKRRLDESTGLGDYSEGNIIYKYLLHMGYFDRLKELGVHIASTDIKEYLMEMSYKFRSFNPPGHLGELAYPIDSWDGDVYVSMFNEEGRVYKFCYASGVGGYLWEDGESGWGEDWYSHADATEDLVSEHPEVDGNEIVENLVGGWMTVKPSGEFVFNVGLNMKGETPPVQEIADFFGIPNAEFDVGGWEYTAATRHASPEALLDPHADEDIEFGNHLTRHGFRSYHTKIAAPWTEGFIDLKAQIAEAYNDMPDYDPAATEAWVALGNESVALYEQLRQRMNVEITDDPEPYATVEEMCADVNSGHMWVSRANADHPVWSIDQNIAFRVVHDAIGHCQSGGKFSWKGENLACGSHFPYVSPLAREALFTDCIGQVAFRSHYGYFGPQKVGFLSQFLKSVQDTQSQDTQPVTFNDQEIYQYAPPAQ